MLDGGSCEMLARLPFSYWFCNGSRLMLTDCLYTDVCKNFVSGIPPI